MRKSIVIEEKLQANAQQLKAIQDLNQPLSRIKQLEVEYLLMEARTYEQMLGKTKYPTWKRLIRQKSFRLLVVVLGMSLYVVGISNLFQQMDLTQVGQWEFVATAMPFWLIFALIPMVLITLLFSRQSQD